VTLNDKTLHESQSRVLICDMIVHLAAGHITDIRYGCERLDRQCSDRVKLRSVFMQCSGVVPPAQRPNTVRKSSASDGIVACHFQITEFHR
jgi:hypothetical protein